MKTGWDGISCQGGTMETYVVRPDEPNGVGIVMLQEIFGVNEAMRHKAEVFAGSGFTVSIPDLFWRLHPRVELTYGAEDRQKGFGLMQRLDLRVAVDDIIAVRDHLSGFPGIKDVSVAGFCLGGKLAVLAGARGSFAAVVSFYGVQLDQNLTELDQISAPLQLHVGDDDAHVPMEVVDKLRSHLAGHSNASVHVYPGAQHGFFNQRRDDVYDERAARQAYDSAVTLLKKAGKG